MAENIEITEARFREICEAVKSKVGWIDPATSELKGEAYDNVEGEVIDQLHFDILEYAGNPEEATYKDDIRASDRKLLSAKRKQEIINIVIKLRNTYFLPGLIIDETVKDVINNLQRGYIVPDDVV